MQIKYDNIHPRIKIKFSELIRKNLINQIKLILLNIKITVVFNFRSYY